MRVLDTIGIRVLDTIGMQVLDTMRGMRVLDTIVIRVSGVLFLTSYNTWHQSSVPLGDRHPSSGYDWHPSSVILLADSVLAVVCCGTNHLNYRIHTA